MNKIKKKKLFRFLPVLFMVLAVAFFVSCDAGSDAGQPTGPDSEYDPSFPEGSDLSLRLSPSVVTVGTTAVEVSASAKLNAGAGGGAPIEGIPVTFVEESGIITFFPNPSYTDAGGSASTTALVLPGTPTGSYSLYAWTTFARDGGPLTRDYKTLRVTSTPLPALTIQTASLAAGASGTPYSAVLTATGGTGSGTYTWTLDGSFPDGLTLVSSPEDALITGTPTAAGTFTFILTVRDIGGDSDSRTFTITIAP